MSGSSSIIHRRGFSSSFRNTVVVARKKKTLGKKSTSTVRAFGGGGGRGGTEKSTTDGPMSEVLEKQYQKLKEIQENAGTTPMENENNENNNTAWDVVDVGNRFLEDAKTRISEIHVPTFLPSSANFDASPNEFVESAKRWEVEQSAKIWDAVDALIELGKRALFGGEKIEFSYATEKATSAVNALAEVARANVPAGTDLTKLDEALKAVTSSTSEYALYAAMIAFFGVVLVVLSNSADPNKGMDEWAALAAKEGEEEPEALQTYDPKVIREYFSKRPVVLLKRAAKSLALLGKFSVGLWMDKKIYGEEPKEEVKNRVDAKRAAQLKDVLISLGPTYVKLGQVLSSRQDLIPKAYVKELRELQDNVPPFDDELARRIIEKELGSNSADKTRVVLNQGKPIASASLGQVYRANLKTEGGENIDVAVKVQRPGALVAISLDIGIIRSFAEPWRKFKGLNSDLEGIIDEWGKRFIAELDYLAEARNGQLFREAMESRQDLANVVTAAPVYTSATTRKVLTTGWINGARLDESKEGDIPKLCAVALTAYLSMLLDLGFLHADPHPGNLFRQNDGKLVILDWGLVTPVSKELSASILQFISHLVSEDFEEVPSDLDRLGFIPSGKREAMEDAGVARAIGLLFSALARGGGASGFRSELGLPDEEKLKEVRKELRGIKDPKKRRDAFIEISGGADSKVAKLTKDLEGVQEKYGNIFQIPSYFGYILRSFSVLEGIGLASDPDYSIANECYPYVARRLLTDNSPTSRRALEQMLYGKDGAKSGRLSVKRVKQLSNAFRSYSSITDNEKIGEPEVVTKEAAEKKEDGERTATVSALPKGAKQILELALSPEGGPAQDIALREFGRFLIASAAGSVSSVFSAPLRALEEVEKSVPKEIMTPLAPAHLALKSLSDVSRVSSKDAETLEIARELTSLIAEQNSSSATTTTTTTTTKPANSEQKKDDSSSQLQFPPVSLSPPSENDVKIAMELLEMAPRLAPGASALALRFASALSTEVAERIGETSSSSRKK